MVLSKSPVALSGVLIPRPRRALMTLMLKLVSLWVVSAAVRCSVVTFSEQPFERSMVSAPVRECSLVTRLLAQFAAFEMSVVFAWCMQSVMVGSAMMPEKLTRMLVVGVVLVVERLKLTRVMILNVVKFLLACVVLVAEWTSEFT